MSGIAPTVYFNRKESLMAKPYTPMPHEDQPKPGNKPSPIPPTKPKQSRQESAETNRAVSAGSGKHRGDRRDMSKTYSGTTEHAARGNTPRRDVTTRAR
jgi:hypothetical protein